MDPNASVLTVIVEATRKNLNSFTRNYPNANDSASHCFFPTRAVL